jgi:hypothetical protein
VKIRISLRILLALVAIVALFGRSCPAAIARQFGRAVAAKQFSATDALFANTHDRCLARFFAENDPVEISVDKIEQTVGDWISGQARIRLAIDFPDAWGGGSRIAEVTGRGVKTIELRFSRAVWFPPAADEISLPAQRLRSTLKKRQALLAPAS